VPQLGTVQYAFVIVAGLVALAVLLMARARRSDQHDRDELRKHIRRLGGPFDPGA
jgi:membrane protein implicated in regulation of membrane protease activity